MTEHEREFLRKYYVLMMINHADDKLVTPEMRQTLEHWKDEYANTVDFKRAFTDYFNKYIEPYQLKGNECAIVRDVFNIIVEFRAHVY